MKPSMRLHGGVGLVLAAMLAACTTPPAPPVAGIASSWVVPGTLDDTRFKRAAEDGQRVWRVDGARSLLTITVRRGGSLARLGHDHILSSRTLQGFFAADAGFADFLIDLDALDIDEPGLRERAGFDTQPSAADIAATRVNLKDKVLETDRFRYARLQLRRLGQDTTPIRFVGELTLHGMRRRIEVPVRLTRDGAEMVANGSFELLQSDYGITPLSLLGGALQVQDRVTIAFQVRAREGMQALPVR